MPPNTSRREKLRRQRADPARYGTYTVTDLRQLGLGSCGWDYEVAGYNRYGELLLKTVHKGEHSMQMECEAWKNRGARKAE